MKPPLAFSIIIPTHNRVDALAACLRGIAALDYPRSQFQVIVVNDGGAPLPGELVSEARTAVDLCVVTQPHRGPSAARNLGVANARNDWLVLTDDDCIPDPDWLSHFARAFGENPGAVLGGETHNGLTGNIYAEASQCLVLFLRDYYSGAGGKRTQLPYLASNNLALSRRVFQSVGGFDETLWFAEDRDFSARVLMGGHQLQSVPTARVYHYRPLTFKDFWRQHERYGNGAYYYHQNRLRAGAEGARIEPFRFYAEMLKYPGRYSARRPGRLAALIAVSQIANAVGFFRAHFRARVGTAMVSARNSL